MPIEQCQDRILLKHPKGSSAEILLYGATVISWQSSTASSSLQEERLFVSSEALLDGSKPVRGGIPVVFPCFGAPIHADHARLSQHGFARSEVWTWGGLVMDNDTGVSVKLTLGPTDRITKVYDKSFRLDYVVTLAEHQLSTDLHVTNTSDAPLEFQALFHTYIRAPSNQVVISPLQHNMYYDKTDPTSSGPKVETRAEVDVRRFTDFVYEDAPQAYEVAWPSGKMGVKSKNLKDLVIWNPQADAGSKLSDMESGGWEKFVCVEPGHVRGFVTVEPREAWVGQQVITVL